MQEKESQAMSDTNKYLSFRERTKARGVAVQRCGADETPHESLSLRKTCNDDDVDVPRMKTTLAPRWKIDLDGISRSAVAASAGQCQLELEESQPQLFAGALKESGKREKGADKVSR